MHFGFSYVGLIYLIMLFVPNIIWTSHRPENYYRYIVNENKVLLAFERIGQVLVCTFMLIFRDFNIGRLDRWSAFLIISFVIMLMYEINWARYFRSGKKMRDFYRSLIGIPVAGATLPILAFIMLGIYGRNPLLIISAVILGIGHVGIHWQHKRELSKEDDNS